MSSRFAIWDSLRVLVSRARGLLLRRRIDEDFEHELEAHLALLTEENVRRGMTAEEARRAARVRLGGFMQLRETHRELHGLPWLETLVQDGRYALRMLRKNPGFTAVAVLTLALGIGANTAIFSALNATVLRPLPYKNPQQLVMLWGLNPSVHSRNGKVGFSAPNFLDFEEQNQVFENMGTFRSTSFTLTGTGNAEFLRAGSVTSGFFKVLGVEPALGRTFLPEEDAAGRDHEVVLSYGLWQRRFGSDPGIVGRTIRLDAEPYTVVGVLRRNFEFSIPGYFALKDIWVPDVLIRDNSRRAYNYLSVIARLKASVSVRQAQADMNAITARLLREYSNTPAPAVSAEPVLPPLEQLHSGVMAATKIGTLHGEVFGDISPLLWILFGAVGFVLLIACANVANLQLARASAREKEIAVRMTLGADRARVVRQLMTESVVLALLAGLLSLVLAWWGVGLLVGLQPAGLPQSTSLEIDVRVLAYTLILSLGTALLFGLGPAFHSPANLDESLRQGGRTTTGAPGRSRLRSALTVSEVALSAVLLIGAGLLMRSFLKLLDVNPGFEIENVLTLTVNLPKYTYPDAGRQAEFYTRLLERVRALPGVKAAGAINDLPLEGNRDSDSFTIERRAPTNQTGDSGSSQDRLATPDYFRAMGIPLIAGRTFTEADTSSAPPVVVISRSVAHQFFTNENPVGQRLTFGAPSTGQWATIVGVVGDVRDLGLESAPDIDIYAPYQQSVLPYNPLNHMSVVIATDERPAGLAAALRGVVRDADKDLPIPVAAPMAAVYAESVATRRFNLLLLGTFAVIAVVLAGVGIYGVISYSTARRTHEVGIRMALGASARQVFLLVVGQGVLLAVFGLALGLGGALALAGVLRNMLFAVTPTDPATLAGVSALLIGVALVACYVPAVRAMKVDPIVALRQE